MTNAAWEANMTSVSSSSVVNSRLHFLFGEKDVADALAAVADGRGEKGDREVYGHGCMEFG